MIIALAVTAIVSRYLLAAVCLIAAFKATQAAVGAGAIYRPHFAVIALWSLVAGLGMLSLATGLGVLGVTFFLREALNIAFAMSIGGWTLLALRLRGTDRTTLP